MTTHPALLPQPPRPCGPARTRRSPTRTASGTEQDTPRVLPYDTVHHLTQTLLAIETDAHRRGWNRPPIPLVIVNRHDRTALQVITLPLQTRSTAARDLPLPDQLHQLATALRSRAGHVRPVQPASRGRRVLLCGVLYHDLHATLDELCHSRRLEALDTDGRRYEIVRRRSRPLPTIGHAAPCDGGAVPATLPGLAAILSAAGQVLTTRSSQ
jgi:hypothetical protein